MVQNLMVWLLERRVVLSERAERLRKQLADVEAEVARLEMAEIVYRQYQEDADAGHPDAAAWEQALEEATGGAPAVPAQSAGATPGAAGQLLFGPRGSESRIEDLPADYRAIMEVVVGGGGPLQAKDVARELGLDLLPAKVEPVRGKLRKLAERGWITRTSAGRYLPR
ncbi:hypothetical protein OHB49_00665 [Streptomyces sp. NBC_01717]|uniref:hypothetical protein n=1 Tax=Streptomyces sp. NBC_01717 TaxID=2975918 RepID=UPI002E377266|nr:hypothetical protein [Streptomyces sp. NBC_01717]